MQLAQSGNEKCKFRTCVEWRLKFLCSYLLQMFEAEEDGAITERELAVILKTALGVTHLSVSRLFAAIDVGDTGKITFGKRIK